MPKHDRAKQEKKNRNALYADKYRQRECEKCKHRSSLRGKCCLCGGNMKKRRRA